MLLVRLDDDDDDMCYVRVNTSACMCMCVYMCVFIYVCVYVCVYMCVWVCMRERKGDLSFSFKLCC